MLQGKVRFLIVSATLTLLAVSLGSISRVGAETKRASVNGLGAFYVMTAEGIAIGVVVASGSPVDEEVAVLVPDNGGTTPEVLIVSGNHIRGTGSAFYEASDCLGQPFALDHQRDYGTPRMVYPVTTVLRNLSPAEIYIQNDDDPQVRTFNSRWADDYCQNVLLIDAVSVPMVPTQVSVLATYRPPFTFQRVK